MQRLQAEALNELGQAAAVPLVSQVRQRVGLAPIPATNCAQSNLRPHMRAERGRKLTGENRRWFDISRGSLFSNQASLDDLITRDPNFSGFRLDVLKLRPLPQTNINLDPAIR